MKKVSGEIWGEKERVFNNNVLWPGFGRISFSLQIASNLLRTLVFASLK